VVFSVVGIQRKPPAVSPSLALILNAVSSDQGLVATNLMCFRS
jgi:hypothetical protein